MIFIDIVIYIPQHRSLLFLTRVDIVLIALTIAISQLLSILQVKQLRRS